MTSYLNIFTKLYFYAKIIINETFKPILLIMFGLKGPNWNRMAEKFLLWFANEKKLPKNRAVNYINILCSFFPDILAPKNFKPKTHLCNFWHQNFVQKNALVKCWWNWHVVCLKNEEILVKILNNVFSHFRVDDFLQHVCNEILAEYTSFVGTRESCIELIRSLDTEQIFEVFFHFSIPSKACKVRTTVLG